MVNGRFMVLEAVVVWDGEIASWGSFEVTRKEHMKRRFKTTRELTAILLWAGLVLSLSGLFPGGVFAHRVNLFAWVEGNTVFVECKWPDGRRVNEGTMRVLDAAGTELLTGKTDQEGNFSFKIPKQEDLKIVLEAGMGHRAEWTVRKEDLSAAGKPTTQTSTTSPGQPFKSEPPPTAVKEVVPGTEPRSEPAAAEEKVTKAPAASLQQPSKSEPSLSTCKEAAPSAQPQVKSALAGKTVTKAPAPLSQQAPKLEPVAAVSGDAASGSRPLAADIEQTLERALDKKLSPILRMLAESRDQAPKLTDVLGGIGYIMGLVGIAAYFKGKSRAS
jgi:nickel transport protein